MINLVNNANIEGMAVAFILNIVVGNTESWPNCEIDKLNLI